MGAPLTDPSTYHRLVGKLNFLQHTRPDISYVVQHLSQFLQFLQAPQVPHLLAGIHVLRYFLMPLILGFFSIETLISAYWLTQILTGLLVLFLDVQ